MACSRLLQSILILFCSLLFFDAHAQIDIYLLSPKVNHQEYRFQRIADTAYVQVGHSEDMGVWFPYFDLKKNIPDGRYQLFVDGTRKRTVDIKRGLPDGIWISYFRNGEIGYISHLKGGKQNGLTKEYDEKTGKINRKSYYENGQLSWSKSY